MTKTTQANEADNGQSQLTAELGADRDMIEERHIHEALAMLRVCHEKAAKPYLDRLAAIHSIRLPPPVFAQVFCSQCGQEFGPGYHGFSHCEDHTEAHK